MSEQDVWLKILTKVIVENPKLVSETPDLISFISNEVKKEKKIALLIIKEDSKLFFLLSKFYEDDDFIEIMMKGIGQDKDFMLEKTIDVPTLFNSKYAPKYFKDEEFVYGVIKKYMKKRKYSTHGLEDDDLTKRLHSLKYDNDDDAYEKEKKNYTHTRNILKFLKGFAENEKFMFTILSEFPKLYFDEYLPEKYAKYDFVFKLIKTNPNQLDYIYNLIKEEKSVFYWLIKNGYFKYIKKASYNVRNSRKINRMLFEKISSMLSPIVFFDYTPKNISDDFDTFKKDNPTLKINDFITLKFKSKKIEENGEKKSILIIDTEEQLIPLLSRIINNVNRKVEKRLKNSEYKPSFVGFNKILLEYIEFLKEDIKNISSWTHEYNRLLKIKRIKTNDYIINLIYDKIDFVMNMILFSFSHCGDDYMVRFIKWMDENKQIIACNKIMAKNRLPYYLIDNYEIVDVDDKLFPNFEIIDELEIIDRLEIMKIYYDKDKILHFSLFTKILKYVTGTDSGYNVIKCVHEKVETILVSTFKAFMRSNMTGMQKIFISLLIRLFMKNDYFDSIYGIIKKYGYRYEIFGFMDNLSALLTHKNINKNIPNELEINFLMVEELFASNVLNVFDFSNELDIKSWMTDIIGFLSDKDYGNMEDALIKAGSLEVSFMKYFVKVGELKIDISEKIKDNNSNVSILMDTFGRWETNSKNLRLKNYSEQILMKKEMELEEILVNEDEITKYSDWEHEIFKIEKENIYGKMENIDSEYLNRSEFSMFQFISEAIIGMVKNESNLKDEAKFFKDYVRIYYLHYKNEVLNRFGKGKKQKIVLDFIGMLFKSNSSTDLMFKKLGNENTIYWINKEYIGLENDIYSSLTDLIISLIYLVKNGMEINEETIFGKLSDSFFSIQYLIFFFDNLKKYTTRKLIVINGDRVLETISLWILSFILLVTTGEDSLFIEYSAVLDALLQKYFDQIFEYPHNIPLRKSISNIIEDKKHTLDIQAFGYLRGVSIIDQLSNYITKEEEIKTMEVIDLKVFNKNNAKTHLINRKGHLEELYKEMNYVEMVFENKNIEKNTKKFLLKKLYESINGHRNAVIGIDKKINYDYSKFK